MVVIHCHSESGMFSSYIHMTCHSAFTAPVWLPLSPARQRLLPCARMRRISPCAIIFLLSAPALFMGRLTSTNCAVAINHRGDLQLCSSTLCNSTLYKLSHGVTPRLLIINDRAGATCV